jgi:dipeptidyl aminopeptidase/acylaminoacyl peptidase
MSFHSLRAIAPAARAVVVALALLALAGVPASAADPLTPVTDFFDNPTVSAAKLSPDVKSLAVLVNGAKGNDRLGVVNLLDLSMKVVAEFGDADVGHFEWVNNNRLVYDSREKHTATGDLRFAPGLFAVNRDGTVRRQLVKAAESFMTEAPVGREILPWNTFMLGQAGAQDSDWVYVVTVSFGSERSPDLYDLVRLNTVNGRTETVDRPGTTVDWWLDAKGKPALAGTLEENLYSLYYLDPKNGKWRKLASTDAYLGGHGAFTPLAFTPKGELYVISDNQQDKNALYRYDLGTGKIADKPLLRLDEFDFRGALIQNADKLLGVRYTADAENVAWFDPLMKEVQAAVDQLLPNRVNRVEAPTRAETPYLLVTSWSDRQPPTFMLYDRDSKQLRKVGEAHPAIQAARMAARDLVQIKARDGLSMPAWLTVPNGGTGKKLPMVVLVHGGPWVRGGEWEWDPDSQFLASRGYVVLEPEFRGSKGYGAAHFQAGFKQWGLAMQNDIADATRWAIAQGIADPKRICIAGASYGGYATLMGLIKDPDLYKCGVNWVGVTDINLMYTGHWSGDSDMSNAFKRYGMPTLIGDPVKDAAQLAATSPLQQAERITQPLLMAYGGADKRVPIFHGRKFHDAVKASNKQVEMVVYENEAHGWSLVKTRVDFWTRVEKFVEKHIGTH